MNINKELILRIYIVLGISWSIWWMLKFYNYDDHSIMSDEIIFNIFIPIPLYFAIKWILKSIK